MSNDDIGYKNANLRQALRDLQNIQSLLASAGQPLLAMQAGALSSKIKAARLSAIRDATFGTEA